MLAYVKKKLYLCSAFRNKHSSEEQYIMVKQKIVPQNKQVRQAFLSRLYFLDKGCKKCPPEYTRDIVRWGHPDGYFLNAQGQKIANDNLNPSSQERHPGGSVYPKDRTTNKLMHILMALTFYGPRPTFKNERGSYVGICHHLIPDKLDYRPANLLCWLTREQHAEADRRQSLIKKAVGIEGMREIGYEQLRIYQDPREISAVDFEKWFNLFKKD